MDRPADTAIPSATFLSVAKKVKGEESQHTCVLLPREKKKKGSVSRYNVKSLLL